jgi:hydroxymethylpyrimidine/phosphomethylpyrimidine kinase
MTLPPVALTIAGSDSGGGAGIEMDLKVFAALGAYGACAITALTAQNTVGVLGAWEAPSAFVGEQLRAVLDDLPVAATKTGMLSSAEVVRVVAEVVRERALRPLVVDPVVVAKDGSHLLSDAGLAALREELLPLATLVTPNLPEAEALVGFPVVTRDDAERAARALQARGCPWVLVKGGHGEGEVVTDLLVGPAGSCTLSSPRRPGGPYHGTGCALSAAITALLAEGRPVPEAVSEGRAFVQRLLQGAVRLGKGSYVLHPRSGEVKGER